jgi:hypothetical protein
MEDKKRVVFQAALSQEEMAQLKAIAKSRGKKMTTVLREWIGGAYKRL